MKVRDGHVVDGRRESLSLVSEAQRGRSGTPMARFKLRNRLIETSCSRAREGEDKERKKG